MENIPLRLAASFKMFKKCAWRGDVWNKREDLKWKLSEKTNGRKREGKSA